MINRIEKTGNFTVISNNLIRNHALSTTARFLMILVLMLPDDWVFNQAGLATMSGIGVNKVAGALKELVTHGYAEIEQKRDAKGRMLPMSYIFNEEPKDQNPPLSKKPPADNPYAEKPCTEKSPLQRTNIQRTYKQKTNIQKHTNKPKNYQQRNWDYDEIARLDREYMIKRAKE
jgi:hypothetical protein